MRFTIITIGKKMPEWVSLSVKTYQNRFSKPYDLQFHEIPLEKRNSNCDIATIKTKEAKQIKKHLNPNDFIIALDEKGKTLSTMKLASQLQDWQTLGKNICFIIGGPDGLDKTILETANFCWSLSPLTFPHPLVRVILVEQLYRVMTVLQNHPYHRE